MANPTIVTQPATSVTAGGAILNADLTDMGGNAFAYIGFQYGLTTAYEHTTPNNYQTQIPMSKATEIAYLKPNTTYHYRAAVGVTFSPFNPVAFGADMTFTTGPAPMPGSGTRTDPYRVSTPADINNIAQIRDAYYKVVNDIDMTGVPFVQAAQSYVSFRGQIDGQNHTLSNASLSGTCWLEYVEGSAVIKNIIVTNFTCPAASVEAGLFLIIEEFSRITNVHIDVNFNITTPNCEAGALCYEVGEDAVISNCSSSGTITAASGSTLGGLIGDAATRAIIKDCHSSVAITSNNVGGAHHATLGGLIGYMASDVQAIRCYATGDVTSTFNAGEDTLGGFTAWTTESEQLIDCYSTGNVTGGNMSGGFVGFTSGDNELYKRCYSTGNVTVDIPGGALIGGFTGWVGGGRSNLPPERLSHCYCTGNVDVTSPVNGNYVGGFCCFLEARAVLSKCYASGDVTLHSAGINNRVAGFSGDMKHDSITLVLDCYSTGDVTYSTAGANFIAGFIAETVITSPTDIINCYSTGLVTYGAGADVSGFTNKNGAALTVTNCFWDTQTSGIATSDYGTGKTTAEMKTQSTFTNWDFIYVWVIDGTTNSGYPFLGEITSISVSMSNITHNSVTLTGTAITTFPQLNAGFTVSRKLL